MISKMVSMPNISIGQARGGAGGAAGGPGAGGAPLDGVGEPPPPGHHPAPPPAHMVPPSLQPFYPSLPVIDSEQLPPPTSPAYITAQVTIATEYSPLRVYSPL